MNIRHAIAADVPHMLDLERACPTAAHWTRQQYEQALRSGGGADRVCLVAERAPVAGGSPASDAAFVISGFLIARHIDREWELENIVVAPESRRSGLGKRLLEMLFAQVRATNGAYVFLEVRESNTAARALYEKLGFRQTDRRKSYYSDPQEDAVLYQWTRRTEGDHYAFSY